MDEKKRKTKVWKAWSAVAHDECPCLLTATRADARDWAARTNKAARVIRVEVREIKGR